MEKNSVGVVYDGCEFVTQELIKKVEKAYTEYGSVRMGVYSDEAFEKHYHMHPSRTYSERERLAYAIKGVEEVFKVETVDDLEQKK